MTTLLYLKYDHPILVKILELYMEVMQEHHPAEGSMVSNALIFIIQYY